MELNQEWLAKAKQVSYNYTGHPSDAVAAAIETYLAEMFKPDKVTELPLDAIPQRDYRKELWIGVATAVSGCDVTTEIQAPGHWANRTLAEFDKIFPKEHNHG